MQEYSITAAPVTPTHPDVLRMLALRDPHHPQELVDVVTRVANYATEDHENVVHVQLPHDVIRRRLIGRHRLTHLWRQPIRREFNEQSV